MLQGWIVAVGLVAAAPQSGPAAPPSSITVEVTGRGRPMILIPGFVSSGVVWKDVVEHFKDRFECHVVTVAGFAGAPAVPAPGLARVRDDLVSYARARKLDRPVLVGHSMGGVLALWIAAAEPDLPGAVISVDGVPFLPALMNPAATAESTRPQAAQLKALYESMTPAQLAAQSRLSFSGMISDQGKVDGATRWAETSDPKTAAALLSDLLTTDLRGEMPRIKAPVLLIPAVKAMSGNPDTMKRALSAYEAQVARVAAREVVAAQTLHFVMLDDPAFLLKTMDEFLAGRASRSH
jgi:N-formylmaleamate deformylase